MYFWTKILYRPRADHSYLELVPDVCRIASCTVDHPRAAMDAIVCISVMSGIAPIDIARPF